jgi:CheY-like chemotaxis protein
MMKIMVVEDNEVNIATAKQFFETIDELEVVYARDYDESIQVYYSEKPCAVITDMCMPMVTGSGEYDRHFGEMIRDTVMNDHSAGSYIRYNLTCTVEEYWKPLIDAVQSGDESKLPYGIDVAMDCQERGVPFVFVTSEYHHGELLCGICEYQRIKGWPEMIDCVDKTEPSAWEKAYKKLKSEAASKEIELP